MAGPGPDTQGGGYRGGPRRWTGHGPRPARHIPWPELFKHHQSVLTGHLKMMDMVRKHCAEGSGNHATAQACVDRTQEMLREFKKVTSSFVPPRDNIDRVPLGASSASMYPGYSPADHIYGEAAAEYGMRVAEAKRKGIEVKTDTEGFEYIVGQSSLSAKEQIEAIKKERQAEKASSSSTTTSANKQEDIIKDESVGKADDAADGTDLFIIDSNPTPIDQLQGVAPAIRIKNKANDKAKRRVSFQDEQSSHETAADVQKKKKAKISESPSRAGTDPKLESDDEFEKTVEARHKEKEEKRTKKNKEDKKRKRESNSSAAQNDEEHTSAEVAVPPEDAAGQKPKKKKKKSKHVEEERAAVASSSKDPEVQPAKKKKRSIESGEGDRSVEMEAKPKNKKQKKETSG